MSIADGKNKLKLSDTGDAPDVDVTPMMNILMILLPVLISMAVFTKITMLQFSLPPDLGTAAGSANAKPKLKMTVVVATQYYAITYGETMLDSIPFTADDKSENELRARISAHKKTFDSAGEAIVAVRDKVRFQRVVRVMDICRESGYGKIGISSATVNSESGV